MKVRLLTTEERLDLTEGEVYEASAYPYEPDCKITLHRRVPDGFNPSCNQYRCAVARIDTPTPIALSCTCGCAGFASRQAAIDAALAATDPGDAR